MSACTLAVQKGVNNGDNLVLTSRGSAECGQQSVPPDHNAKKLDCYDIPIQMHFETHISRFRIGEGR